MRAVISVRLCSDARKVFPKRNPADSARVLCGRKSTLDERSQAGLEK